jgi:hypothetical protein
MASDVLSKLLDIIVENLTANEKFRREMQGSSIFQLMDLNKPLFIEVTMDLFKIDQSKALQVYEVVKKEFIDHQTKTLGGSASKNPALKDKLDKLLKLKQLPEYKYSFVVYNFRWVQDHLYKTWSEEASKLSNMDLTKARGLVGKHLNIEHGAGAGAPLAASRAARGLAVTQLAYEKLGIPPEQYQRLLQTALKDSSKDLKLNIVYDLQFNQNVEIDSNKILGNYIFSLKLGKSKDNNTSSTLEGIVANDFRKLVVPIIKKQLEIYGVENITPQILSAIQNGIPELNLKTKIKKPANLKIDKSQKKQIKAQSSVTVGGLSKGSTPTTPKGVVSSVTRAPAINIVALLNAKLTAEVRKRMTYPRLVYRTGRFASSVKVTQATTDNIGQSIISYTYDKNPYQIFEQGQGRLPWATPARDPRLIIEESIRDIAVGVIAGKFNLRRE